MDEKRPTMSTRLLSSATCTRRSRLFSIRRLLLAIALTSIMYYFYPALFTNLVFPRFSSHHGHQGAAALKNQEILSNIRPLGRDRDREEMAMSAASSSSTPIATAAEDKKVTLEAHIMSKCPDARDCLRDLVVPAMSQISPLVDFKLYYIGTVSPTTNDVTCKHGPKECLGNSISLCAQDIYGHNDTKASLGFTNCLIADYKHIPDKGLVQDCAMEHGVDFEGVNRCLSEDGRGEELLRESVTESKALGVKYSCTVRLAGEKWCVRDSGEWKECGEHGGGVDALVDEIKKLAGEEE